MTAYLQPPPPNSMMEYWELVHIFGPITAYLLAWDLYYEERTGHY